MKTLLSILVFVRLAAIAGGQDITRVTPEKYALLARTTSPDEAVSAVDAWMSGRRATTAMLRDALASGESRLPNGRPLRYESLLSTRFADGAEADARMLDTRAQEFAAVLVGVSNEGAGRRDFVDQMQRIEAFDKKITEIARDRVEDEKIGNFLAWAAQRAMLAIDFKSKQAAQKAGQAKIPIEVQTLHPFKTPRTEVHNYEVVRVLVFWSGNQNRESPFPQFSSPAHDTVDAGNYYIWCRRRTPGGVIEGEKKLFRLSGAQAKPLEIWIPLDDAAQ